MKKLFAALVFVVTMPAYGIVNVEDMRFEAKFGFSAKMTLDFSGASGNTDKSQADTGVKVQWQSREHTRFLVGHFSYRESRGVRDTDKGFVHGRWIIKRHSSRHQEVFAQLSRDEFARLTLRALLGAGYRFKIRDEENAAFSFGLGGFYEQEKLEASALESARNDELWRINSYFVYKRKVDDRVDLSFLQYYQPAAERFADFRMLTEFNTVVKLAERLSLKFGIDVAHDEKPPLGVKKTDISYRSGIIIDF